MSPEVFKLLCWLAENGAIHCSHCGVRVAQQLTDRGLAHVQGGYVWPTRAGLNEWSVIN